MKRLSTYTTTDDSRRTRSPRRIMTVIGALTGLFAAEQVSNGHHVPADGPNYISQYTYYIGESTNFSVPGSLCQNTDVNNITSSLRTRLDDNNWNGVRYHGSTAWPSHLKEHSLNSAWGDHTQGDNYSLSVYAGHGNVNVLQYGHTTAGSCTVNIGNQMRMGRLAGGRNRTFMYLTSCTGKLGSQTGTIFNSGSGQHLAYHNSPSIYNNQPRDMFQATWSQSNRLAWVNVMDDRPGTGWNSPIIYTRANSQSYAEFNHWNAQLAPGITGVFYPPLNYWYYTYKNNGGC